jgi:hypothetical protein
MRDELEKLIIENRAFIMDEEPDEGHIERFQVKLNQQKKHKLIWRNGLKIAAAVVFVLMAVNQARLYLTPEKKLKSHYPQFRMNIAKLSSTIHQRSMEA